MVDASSLGLLGRHVVGSAGDRAGSREAGVVDRTRQGEIGEKHPLQAVFQQDVGGLDVAMRQSLGVGGGQARGDLDPDPQDVADFQRAVLLDAGLERQARDVNAGNTLCVRASMRRPPRSMTAPLNCATTSLRR